MKTPGKEQIAKTLSELLTRIEVGRLGLKRDRQTIEACWDAIHRRDAARRKEEETLSQRLPEDELGRRVVEAERASQRSEVEKLEGEVCQRRRPFTEAIAFIGPFANDVKLLLDRLPIETRWRRFRQAITGLQFHQLAAWIEPPTNPDLETLELRLKEMLDVAKLANARAVPKLHSQSPRTGDNRVSLYEWLVGELGSIKIHLSEGLDLEEIRNKHADLAVWPLIQKHGYENELLKPDFRPKQLATKLVSHVFGIAPDTLRKLRQKGNQGQPRRRAKRTKDEPSGS